MVALLLHEEKDLNGGLDFSHNELPAKDSEVGSVNALL